MQIEIKQVQSYEIEGRRVTLSEPWNGLVVAKDITFGDIILDLHDPTNGKATIVKASPVWWGYLNEAARARNDASKKTTKSNSKGSNADIVA